MFETHPNLSVPDAATELWRYIDLSKLLSLLERRALWFARLDTLNDPYEGLPPRTLIDDMWSSASSAAEPDRQDRIATARHNTRAFSMGREAVAVSCWHASPVESAAMWSLYARSGEGIAIRSTVERLGQSFIQPYAKVHAGMVRYIDYESHRLESINLMEWATFKRASFAHEREFRAIIIGETGQNVEGVTVKVDLDTLVSGIVLSPEAAPWWVALIRDVCARFALNASVEQSGLLRTPAYMNLVERPR